MSNLIDKLFFPAESKQSDFEVAKVDNTLLR